MEDLWKMVSAVGEDVRGAVFATVDLAAPNAVVGGDVLTGNAMDTVGPSGRS